MAGSIPSFRVPLNLPHAGTIALRIKYHAQGKLSDDALRRTVEQLVALLGPYREAGENPASEETGRVIDAAARLGCLLVGEIERLKAGSDRLGQAVRNLFECLGMGEEGARISLRAGENPNSALRP